MEPLSPNDPLFNLLGKARPVEPRPNFTQNVMRAIRQAPQSLGLGERVSAWFRELTMPRLALAGAAVIAFGMVAVAALQKPVNEAPAVAQQTPAPVMQPAAAQPAIYHVSATMILAATAEAAPAPPPPVDDMDPMGLLLVRQDTSALTDSELALLVY
jgi:hypothetical protein